MPTRTVEVNEPHEVLEYVCEVHEGEVSRDANDFRTIIDMSGGQFGIPMFFYTWECLAEWAASMNAAVIDWQEQMESDPSVIPSEN